MDLVTILSPFLLRERLGWILFSRIRLGVALSLALIFAL